MHAAASRFAEGVEAFAVEELPLSIEATAAVRLRAKLAAGGPVLVGERHGVEQNPLVAYTLARRFGLRSLGLDWSVGLQPAVDAFLAGGPLDVDAFAAGGDGRITAGHFAVLRSLRDGGLLDRVVLLDPTPSHPAKSAPHHPTPDRALAGTSGPATWSERDRAMAARLLQETRGTPALVMAGSLHTRLRRHLHGEPLGAHVARARPGAIELRLRYPGDVLSGVRQDACVLRSAGAWLELTVPCSRPGLTPAG